MDLLAYRASAGLGQREIGLWNLLICQGVDGPSGGRVASLNRSSRSSRFTAHKDDLLNTSHAALCTARHGVRSHPVPIALVGECSILAV
jgi:hypothetical protein